MLNNLYCPLVRHKVTRLFHGSNVNNGDDVGNSYNHWIISHYKFSVFFRIWPIFMVDHDINEKYKKKHGKK